MGVSKTITVVCDYRDCKGSGQGPAIISWDETAADKGLISPPEEAKYIVTFNQATPVGNRLFSFCCQLHAAEYFLPVGYEAKQKQVITLPEAAQKDESLPPWMRLKPVVESESWMDEPRRVENPVNGQADGCGSVEDGNADNV